MNDAKFKLGPTGTLAVDFVDPWRWSHIEIELLFPAEDRIN